MAGSSHASERTLAVKPARAPTEAELHLIAGVLYVTAALLHFFYK
jgi:hypothetical protein